MRVFTVYTPTHAPMLEEYFLPSLREHEPDLPPKVIELAQHSASGTIKTDGFVETLREKYRELWDFANSLPYGELILCSDCDIQFFRPFRANLESYMDRYDIVFQTNVLDPPQLNIGFFCMRWLPATRALITTMLNTMVNFRQEELAVNYLLRIHDFPIRYRLLPPEDYWTLLATGDRQFSPDRVPPAPYMHHANSVLGTEGKLALMTQVRQVVLARREQSPRPELAPA